MDHVGSRPYTDSNIRKARTNRDLVREPCLTDLEYVASEKEKVGAVAKVSVDKALLRIYITDAMLYGFDWRS